MCTVSPLRQRACATARVQTLLPDPESAYPWIRHRKIQRKTKTVTKSIDPFLPARSAGSEYSLEPAAVVRNIGVFTLTLDRRVRGHRQSYNYINLMRLLFLCDAPTARRF